jgi:hypothetical protein
MDLRVPAGGAVIRDALERARAAVWDAHYGNGISVGYARSVDEEIETALGKPVEPPHWFRQAAYDALDAAGDLEYALADRIAEALWRAI